MPRVVVAGIVEFPPELRDEALIKSKELIEGAYTEKGCIHYLWTADLNHPGRIVVYEEWESGCDLDANLQGEWYRNMFGHLAQYNILSAETNKFRVEIKEPVYGDDGVATRYFSDEPQR
jgi:quinol monooxygenase YgiN